MDDVDVLAEVLTVVMSIRILDGDPALCVLLWQRELAPARGLWSLPGGALYPDCDFTASARRHLEQKVDVCDVAHLEQLTVLSDPRRVPGTRRIASAYLALVPIDISPRLPFDTQWHRIDSLPPTCFDHRDAIDIATRRINAKLSYTNIAYALAPQEFSMSILSDIYSSALSYPVDATNLLRILSRRGVITTTGTTGPPGPHGGRPPALYRFNERELRVTDEFATLRPPP